MLEVADGGAWETSRSGRRSRSELGPAGAGHHLLIDGRSFRVRRLDEHTTVIRGRSAAFGAFVVLGGMAMSGLLLLPFSFGFRFGAFGLLLCAAVGLGYGYRVVVTSQGITIRSTWLGFGLPFSREDAELDATIDDYIPWGSDESEGVGIGFHCLPVPERDRGALKKALWSAIDRARGDASSG